MGGTAATDSATVDLRDPRAFGAFYDGAVGPVYRYLYRACGGVRSKAEDLTQDTFLAAVRHIADTGGADVTVPWLLVVARRKLIDDHRRHEREERKLALAWDAGRSTPNEPTSPAVAAETLQALPPAQRTALVLRYVDDLPVNEVAEALGRSVHATESLLARARQALRHSAQESPDD